MARKGYKMVKKMVSTLQVGEMTYCKHGGRYDGVSIGRDEEGFFACTHRAASERYPSPAEIPLKTIKWIRSTG